MSEKDKRPYIALVDTFPENLKTVDLTDKAFRHVIELWCYCSRGKTDGVVPKSVLRRMTTPATLKQLKQAGFIEDNNSSSVTMHDYLKHQWSKAEIEEKAKAKAERGAKGAHVRNHENKGILDPKCYWCTGEIRDT